MAIKRSTNFLLLSVAAFAFGCGDNLSPGPVIETRLAQTTFVAGEVVAPTCEITDKGIPVLDKEGVPVVDTTPLTITYQQETSFDKDASGAVIATRAGAATVRCSAPALALLDETPEEIEIIPGPIVRVVTQLDADWTYAGQPVGAHCLAFDAYDNPIVDFDHQMVINPTGGGTTVEPGMVTATIAGSYEVNCVVPNITAVDAAPLLVLPALPAVIVGRLEPERPVYTIDQQVQIIADAYDLYGNRVDEASFAYSASPSISSPSEARYHFTADGSYTLTATVTSQTHQNIPLSVSLPVLVNTTGPMIECMRSDSPQEVNDAYQITQGPSTLTVPVRASDAFAVQSVTIGGQPASFSNTSGNWTAGVPIGFGINFVDVVAVDQHGLENSTTCFISAAPYYTAESSFMPGAVGLRLDPRAISDSNPAVLDSLNDILQTVIRSNELLTIVDDGLKSSNPINDGGCGFFACEPDINYTGGSIGWNTPSSTMSLITNGLRVAVHLPTVKARVSVCGTTCCPGGTNVDINVTAIDATIDFTLAIQSGVLRATLNSGSPVVTIGTVSLNGSGFCGFIVENLDGIFQSTLQGVIDDALTNYIQSDLAPILDGVVSSLDVNTLGTTFNVPQLDGTGTVNVAFGLQLSSLSITTTRFLLGLGTRFTAGTIAQNRTSLGVGRKTQIPLLDPPGTTTTRPVGLSFYEGAMNHMLHALWRGGFFTTTLSLGGGTAVIDAKLPPMMAFAASNQATLAFGGLQSTITIPGIISNLQVTFGGDASAGVTLSGNDLAFGTLTINGLYASFAKPLTQNQRNALEDFLRDVLQTVLADAISDGLPAIPIPSFTLPASVGAFGLPVGAELGIVSPQLSTNGSHVVLTGAFGRRN